MSEKKIKMTNKPCPGCGYTPRFRSNTGYRREDEVCTHCKKKLKQAEAYVQLVAQLSTDNKDKNDCIAVNMPSQRWRWAHVFHTPAFARMSEDEASYCMKQQLLTDDDCEGDQSCKRPRDLRHLIDEVFIDLIDNCSTQVESHRSINQSERAAMPFFVDNTGPASDSEFSLHDSELRLFKPEVFRLLKLLRVLIAIVTDRIYKRGYRDGSNLLERLRDGGITTDHFEKSQDRQK